MYLKPLLLCPVLLLAACAGGSTAPTVIPISANGFASESNSFPTAYDFTFRNATRIVGTRDDIRLEKQSDIRIVGTTGEGEIEVTIEGQTYIIPRDPDTNRTVYENGDDEIALYLRINDDEARSEFINALGLFYYVDDYLNSGSILFGFDTDPKFVATQDHSATYEGTVAITLRNGFDGAFGGGPARFAVNFADATVAGTASIADERSSSADFTFDPIGIAFDETSIVANGFSGDLSLLNGTLNGTLVSAQYDGRFFGPEAESLGANLYGEIDVDGLDSNTFFEGVLVLQQQDAP